MQACTRARGMERETQGEVERSIPRPFCALLQSRRPERSMASLVFLEVLLRHPGLASDPGHIA